MTPQAAKSIIFKALKDLGHNPFQYKLTARTIDFSDLARSACVFVRVQGWEPHPDWLLLKAEAKRHGFCIE